MKLKFLKENLINPSTGKICTSFIEDELIFECNNKFKVLNNTPIIIDESNSIFKVCDILKKTATSQNSKYRNNGLKNIIRKRILPSLSKDFGLMKRYKDLANNYSFKRVLIVGA